MEFVHFERLSGVDSAMLALEDENTHMHVGAVAIFDAAPLTGADGDFDIDRVREAIDAGTAQIPRFRQRLSRIPLFDRPIWVDDRQFNLIYHVRHTAMPHPGSIRKVKRLTGRVMSQKLDAHKPLWEVWVVEGLEDDRFALILKVHHCMVDGVGGIDLLTRILSPDPEAVAPKAARWIPRSAPSGREMLSDEIGHRLSLPLSLASAGWRALTKPRKSLAALREGASSLRDSLSFAGASASATPLDEETGPYRRVDWLQLDLSAALQARRAFGGTLNDLILACAAGALGRFLRQRGLHVEDLDFRASIPVNIRRDDERGELGNHISSLFAPLPIEEEDPVKRLERVIEITRELKTSVGDGGWGALDELSDRLFPSLMGELMKLMGTRLRPVNVYISNIPGPRVPVYLLGARMLEIYPVAPVVHVLAIALFSYDKGLYWGFNADWDRFPDLHDLIAFTEQEFELLLKAAPETPVTTTPA
ncbi:MAG: wax ester/triacylglycerol synthase family O-acyltransferase [bacterium]|nr:wax ester/triacylglycerol synthase family O-acyltransferase [bacterium]